MEHKSLEQLILYGTDAVFTVKAKNFETGEIKIIKNQTAETYIKNIGYLKYLNAAGYNVFLSPSVAGGVFVLLDDISRNVIDRLNSDGFEPFYFLETSPANYQAVIKLSDNSLSLSKEIHAFMSRQLAELYGADINSSDIGHFFRLAGFTNRKEKYRTGGLYPFVKLYTGINKTCSKGNEYVNRVLQGIGSGILELLTDERHIDTTPALQAGEKKTVAGSAFQYIQKVYSSGGLSDVSALDYKAAFYAIRKGFAIDEIKSAILKLSPDIENRKAGHIDDYIDRTVKNALSRL